MMTPERRPSDHGGDGGYEHCCRECGISFTLLAHVFGIEKVPEGENKDGDICEDCYEPTAETE